MMVVCCCGFISPAFSFQLFFYLLIDALWYLVYFSVILHFEGFCLFPCSFCQDFRVFSGLICRLFVASLPSVAPLSFLHYPHLFHICVFVQLCPLCGVIVCFLVVRVNLVITLI